MFSKTIFAVGATIATMTSLATAQDFVIDNRCDATFNVQEYINGTFHQTLLLKPGQKYREAFTFDDTEITDRGLPRHFGITDTDIKHNNPTIIADFQAVWDFIEFHSNQRVTSSGKVIPTLLGSGDNKCRAASSPEGNINQDCTAFKNLTFAICGK